jgi:hypothetical protein
MSSDPLMVCKVRAVLYRDGLPHKQVDERTFRIADFTYDFVDQRLTRDGMESIVCPLIDLPAAVMEAHPDLFCESDQRFYSVVLNDLIETAFGLKPVEHTYPGAPAAY